MEGRPNKRVKLTNTGGDNDSGATDNGKCGDNKYESINPSTSTLNHETSAPENPPTTSKRRSGAVQPGLAVRSMIPNLKNCLIDATEIKEYDEILVEQVNRLQKLSEYTNAKANIYALGRLLPTATWGQYKPINDRSKVLCNPATNEPLTIWVVGQIAKMWFTKFGNLEKQATIMIMPLSKSLAQQSTLLLAKMSSPTTSSNQQATQIIQAIKWQNARGGDSEDEPVLFDAVYVIRVAGSLKTQTERPLWKLVDLKMGDLILLEMKMTRYSKKQEDKWHSRAQYDMLAIYLLDICETPEEDTLGTSLIDGLAI
ncbi:hypothetical protein DFJ58DRAFT_859695 [Suillus subalutaceus]|uniref:uncharacterized protein n=1 Tax=Suillus subalutaceus TaxID=48586 RepID=UPI001B878BA2|nr:uncharacterized protein DFJ58DRAFT_859695 [Suillus subalutaceus]KAG1839202.1 hypothetical protein DFJ58DRAFT_859695 [Suillus subalutaceus]